jgi:protocatechuate 3,4-dioxygenase, beta subunit
VDQDARDRLVASYDHSLTEPEWALGYNWDIVLTGPKRTWTENEALGAAGDEE